MIHRKFKKIARFYEYRLEIRRHNEITFDYIKGGEISENLSIKFK